MRSWISAAAPLAVRVRIVKLVTRLPSGSRPQQAAVGQVLGAGVSLLTGGPGTGKSRTVAAVVQLLRAKGSEVALSAPTGRAAKRLEELTDHPAVTVHRLLGAQGDEARVRRLERVFRRGHRPEKVAGAIVKAVEGGRAVVPVGVEAWAGWFAHRLTPIGAQQFVARRGTP